MKLIDFGSAKDLANPQAWHPAASCRIRVDFSPVFFEGERRWHPQLQNRDAGSRSSEPLHHVFTMGSPWVHHVSIATVTWSKSVFHGWIRTRLVPRISWLQRHVDLRLPWVSMGFHGFPWVSMGFHGLPMPPRDIHSLCRWDVR